jgi:hypothetical protein
MGGQASRAKKCTAPKPRFSITLAAVQTSIKAGSEVKIKIILNQTRERLGIFLVAC